MIGKHVKINSSNSQFNNKVGTVIRLPNPYFEYVLVSLLWTTDEIVDDVTGITWPSETRLISVPFTTDELELL